MFRTPASICFSAPKDVFAPGLIAGTVAGFGLVDCASAEPFTPNWAEARVMETLLTQHLIFRVDKYYRGVAPINVPGYILFLNGRESVNFSPCCSLYGMLLPLGG